MVDWERRAGVAAGHPVTADVGAAILEEGGTAADAAVAAALASCVAETVMSGIAGGGHAIWWTADRREALLLDFFVTVPGLGGTDQGAPTMELEIAFGEQPVPYSVGIATCAVPGVPAGLEELWRRHGVLPLGTPVRAGANSSSRWRADAAGSRHLPRDARARLHAP
jgi:gamma-glutamyltranspeptidase / glutathione hydrolase